MSQASEGHKPQPRHPSHPKKQQADLPRQAENAHRLHKERTVDTMKEKIVRLLEKNARLSNKQIAVLLGITEADAAAAIEDLEKSGVLKGYSAVVDWDKLGTDHVSALIELKVTPKRDFGFDEIARRIMEFQEVESVYLMSGGYDLLVEIRGASFQEIALFVAKRLSTLDSVLSTATHFLLTRYKENGIVVSGEPEEERRSMVL